MMNQHEIRSFALQTIFLMNTDKELQPADAMTQVQATRDLTGEVAPYAQTLVEGVCDKKESLNEQITAHLKKGWRLERISTIDLSILQLSLYEILFSESIPDVSAINEALNLTQEFSDDKSKPFINGILSNFIKK